MEVYEILGKCPAATKIVVIGACRNDPVAARAVADPVSDEKPKALAVPPGGVVTIFSCSRGELAAESDRLKHSVFFHHLLEGLRGKAANKTTGEVDVLRLYQHLLDEVPATAAKERGEKFHQTPALSVERELTGRVVLAAQPHAALRPDFRFEGPYADLSAPGKTWAEVLPFGNWRCSTDPTFTADRRGLWVVTCSHKPADNTAPVPALVLFDTTTGKRLRTYDLRVDGVNGFVLTRDGRRAYVGGCAGGHTDGVVLIIDLHTGRELDRWTADAKCVKALRLPADERFSSPAGTITPSACGTP